MKISKYLLLSIVIIGLSIACSKEYVVPVPIVVVPPPPPCDTCSTPTVLFTADIQPIFTASCATATCHDGTNDPGNTYGSISGYVTAGDPSLSVFYTTLLPGGNMFDWGYSNLNAAEVAKIETWIEEGALNN